MSISMDRSEEGRRDFLWPLLKYEEDAGTMEDDDETLLRQCSDECEKRMKFMREQLEKIEAREAQRRKSPVRKDQEGARYNKQRPEMPKEEQRLRAFKYEAHRNRTVEL